VSEPELPNAELDVMRCLWQGQPLTARAIREELHRERPMSHSSVCSLLARLETKGYVAREKGTNGKAFMYRPVKRPKLMKRRLIGELLDRLFAGSGVDLVAALFESRPPTDEQVHELQKLIDELRNRKQQQRKR
jgi:predicted transcriptional regulator